MKLHRRTHSVLFIALGSVLVLLLVFLLLFGLKRGVHTLHLHVQVLPWGRTPDDRRVPAVFLQLEGRIVNVAARHVVLLRRDDG